MVYLFEFLKLIGYYLLSIIGSILFVAILFLGMCFFDSGDSKWDQWL